MLPTRPPYLTELKRQIFELVRAGRSPAELAREFEPTAQTIQNWVRQADRRNGLEGTCFILTPDRQPHFFTERVGFFNELFFSLGHLGRPL